MIRLPSYVSFSKPTISLYCTRRIPNQKYKFFNPRWIYILSLFLPPPPASSHELVVSCRMRDSFSNSSLSGQKGHSRVGLRCRVALMRACPPLGLLLNNNITALVVKHRLRPCLSI